MSEGSSGTTVPCIGHFQMRCGFSQCTEVFSSMLDFENHVASHLAQYDHERIFDADGVLLPAAYEENFALDCAWNGCTSPFFASFVALLRHVFFHALHTRLKCKGAAFLRQKNLPTCTLDSASCNVIPDCCQSFKCAWDTCETEYDSPYGFYSHLDNHCSASPKTPNSRRYPCIWQGCTAVVKNLTRLTEHVRKHTQEKIIACPTCGGMFSNNTKFQDHIKRQTAVDPSTLKCFLCSHCNKQFSSERILKDHMRHHVNQYKCPLCDMTCPTPSALRSHIHYRHTEERPHKCPECNYRAKRANDLIQHMAIHSSILLKCGMAGCTFTCKRRGELLTHYKKIHKKGLKEYKCHVCAAIFYRGFHLTKHLKTKHNIKWPAGHQRFKYKEDAEGYFCLETIRYESIELSEQLSRERENREAAAAAVEAPADSYNLEMLGNVAAALKQSSDEEDGFTSDMDSCTDFSEAVPSVMSDEAVSSPVATSSFSRGEEFAPNSSKRYFREVSLSQCSDFSEDA